MRKLLAEPSYFSSICLMTQFEYAVDTCKKALKFGLCLAIRTTSLVPRTFTFTARLSASSNLTVAAMWKITDTYEKMRFSIKCPMQATLSFSFRSDLFAYLIVVFVAQAQIQRSNISRYEPDFLHEVWSFSRQFFV